jgi:2-succinyl-5-enolpyruvyl-6-hydroxy-3-cyclohexene-1-carboxylate synthase
MKDEPVDIGYGSSADRLALRTQQAEEALRHFKIALERSLGHIAMWQAVMAICSD